MEQNGDYSLEKWFTPMGDLRNLTVLKIPSSGQIIWKLDSADFNWFNGKLKVNIIFQVILIDEKRFQ